MSNQLPNDSLPESYLSGVAANLQKVVVLGLANSVSVFQVKFIIDGILNEHTLDEVKSMTERERDEIRARIMARV